MIHPSYESLFFSFLNLRISSGYGYQVRFVEDLENIDLDLAASMEWALAEIKKIQTAARKGTPIVKPRWPVLILRTPKVDQRYHSLSPT
jgi:phosphoketolase